MIAPAVRRPGPAAGFGTELEPDNGEEKSAEIKLEDIYQMIADLKKKVENMQSNIETSHAATISNRDVIEKDRSASPAVETNSDTSKEANTGVSPTTKAEGARGDENTEKATDETLQKAATFPIPELITKSPSAASSQTGEDESTNEDEERHDEVLSSNHDHEFQPIFFEQLPNKEGILKYPGAKTMKQCDAALIEFQEADANIGSDVPRALTLEDWIVVPEEKDEYGLQVLNDKFDEIGVELAKLNFDPSPTDLMDLANSRGLGLDIIECSQDASIVSETEDTASTEGENICLLKFKGSYYSAYPLQSMQEYVYNKLSEAQKQEMGITEEMGGSPENIIFSMSKLHRLRSAFHLLRAFLLKDLFISFIPTSRGLITEEQLEDLSILLSHAPPQDVSSEKSQLDSEFEKLSELEAELDGIDHTNTAAINRKKEELKLIEERVNRIPES